MSDNVVEKDTIEDMDAVETAVKLTLEQGCGKTDVEFDQSNEGAKDPDVTFDNTHDTVEIDAALDEDCICLETSDDEIYEYDPEDTPDAAQVANNILKETVTGWRDDWDLIVEDEPNYFTKINEIRNFDPLKEKADQTSQGKYIRRGFSFDGNLVNLPATYIQEQGLCKQNNFGVQTDEYFNWINFAGERLAYVRSYVRGKPDAIQTQLGEIMTPSFSKDPLVTQFQTVIEDGIERLEELEGKNIEGINVKKGKRILKQIDNLLEHMEEHIIPTTDKNLKKCLKRTAVLRIKAGGSLHELDYWQSGKGNQKMVTVKAPPMLGWSVEKRKEHIDKWLNRLLLPVLTKWVEDFEKVLPDGMKSLATLAGLDIENFAIPGPQRSDCHECHRPAEEHANKNRIVKPCLFHIRIGFGTLFISVEGHGAEGLGRGKTGNRSKMHPKCIPENSLCVPFTDCEVKKQPNMLAALRSIVDIFFNEKKANYLCVSFDAKGGERKSLKEFIDIVCDKDSRPGFRVVEGSVMVGGSFPNLCMRNFLYTSDNPKVRVLENAGTLVTFLFGKRVPGHLYSMPTLQGVFSVKKLLEKPNDKTNQELLLYTYYNLQDSTITQYSFILGVVSLILQSPIMVACGAVNFINEMCLMILESTSRTSVTGRDHWRSTVENLPPPNRLVLEIQDITYSSSGLTQVSRFLGGCFSEYGIPKDAQFCPRPVWETQASATISGEASIPDIATRKKGKNQKPKMQMFIQDHEGIDGNPDVAVLVADKQIIEGMNDYDISENNVPNAQEDLWDGVRACSDPEAQAQVSNSDQENFDVQIEDHNIPEEDVPTIQPENLDQLEEDVPCPEPDDLENDTLSNEAGSSQKRGGEDHDILRRSEEPKSKRQAVVDRTSGVERQIEGKNEGWGKIIELLPLSKNTVERVIRKDTLTEFDAQFFITQVQSDVREVTERSVIKLNNRSKEALEEQKDIEKKKDDVDRIKQEVYENHSNIMKLMKNQTVLRNNLKEANAHLTQARRKGVTRRALERENLEAERKKRDDNAVEGGALFIKKIKEKVVHRFGIVNVEALGQEPPEPAPALMTPISRSEQYPSEQHQLIPNEAPPSMWAIRELFLAYARWRWRYMCLVKTLMAILKKAEKAIERFNGKPAQQAANGRPAVEGTGRYHIKFKNGAFKTPGDKDSQTVAQISKIWGKIIKEDEINWGNSKRMIGVFKTLALAFQDSKPPENEVEILGTESASERAAKNKKNASIRCYEYLKEFAAEINEACMAVTGGPLDVPWTCRNQSESRYEDIFENMAEKVLEMENQNSSSEEIWDIKKAKAHLEWAIYRFISPTKLYHSQAHGANVASDVENNQNMDAEVVESIDDGEVPETDRQFAERIE